MCHVQQGAGHHCTRRLLHHRPGARLEEEQFKAGPEKFKSEKFGQFGGCNSCPAHRSSQTDGLRVTSFRQSRQPGVSCRQFRHKSSDVLVPAGLQLPAVALPVQAELRLVNDRHRARRKLHRSTKSRNSGVLLVFVDRRVQNFEKNFLEPKISAGESFRWTFRRHRDQLFHHGPLLPSGLKPVLLRRLRGGREGPLHPLHRILPPCRPRCCSSL